MSESYWSRIILIDMDTEMARPTSKSMSPLAFLWPSFSKGSDLRVSFLKQLCGERLGVVKRNNTIRCIKVFCCFAMLMNKEGFLVLKTCA